MIGAWYIITLIISLSSLFLMSFTIYDLTVMMRDPFSSSAIRVKLYFILAFGFSTIISVFGFGLSLAKNNKY